MANNTEKIYIQKKRRVLGEIMQEQKVTNAQSWVSVHKSHKDELMTYESKGLVVSINGSGTLKQDHTQCKDAAHLTSHVREQGGVIINGGRKSGVMAASTTAAKGKSMGVVFPEIKKEASSGVPLALVNSPQPRTELLATCAPIIVIFRGGLGTFMVLMRSIVHMKNRQFHPEQPEQLLFISNYWIGLLTSMMNLGTLPKEFLMDLHLFNTPDDIIAKLPQ